MKLWILKPVDDMATTNIKGHEVKRWTWDCVYGIVVRARSEEKAREVAYHEAGDEGGDVWLDPKLTSCEALTGKGESGVVLRDFLAG